MHAKKTKTQIRESRIDEALTESFPASDPPFYVGVRLLQPHDNQVGSKDAGEYEESFGQKPSEKKA